MTFEEWCYSRRIKGNYKEALFHSLAAKHGAENVESLGPEIWWKEWLEVLDIVLKSLAG